MQTKIPNETIKNSNILSTANITDNLTSKTGKLVASDTAISTINDKVEDIINSGGSGGTSNVDITTIKVGTTTTLSPGSNATVSGVIADDVLKLNFGIPAGFDGSDGLTPTISVNSTKTVDSTEVAKVTNVGSSTDVLLNFEIPKGEKGDPGEHAVAALNPRGEYNSNADPTYLKNDYITYENKCYVCKIDNPSNTAPSDGSGNDVYWQLLALQGPRGSAGKNGLDGISATVAVGTAEMVAYNQPLRISNSGTNTNAIFDFQIPQSFTNIEIGTVETIDPSEQATVIKRGTPDNVILDFKLNRGFRGADTAVGPSENEYLAETEQVWGKWVNGKTIYRYTFVNIPQKTNGPFTNGGIDLSFLSIDEVIFIESIRKNSVNSYFGNRYFNVIISGNVLNSALDYGLQSAGAGVWTNITLYYTRTDEIVE